LVAAGCCTPPTSAVLRGWALLARGIVALPDGGAGLNRRLAEATLPREAVEDLAAGGFALDVMDDVLREMAAARPLADLASIEVPVWLVNGRYDHFRTRERAFVRAGRDTRLRVVPRAKHLVSLEQPVAFTRLLLEAAGQGSWPARRRQARTPPTTPAEFGTTTTSSPSRSSTWGVIERAFPPPR